MSLTRLTVSGYRGFSAAAQMTFAVPNGQPGSGLTVITGPNNSGKTSILECLTARSREANISFHEGLRHVATDLVTIEYVVNEKRETLRSLAKGSSETIKEGVDTHFELLVLPSRRSFSPYFSKFERTRDEYVRNPIVEAQRQSHLKNFEGRIFQILRDPARFNILLYEILGYAPQWVIDLSAQGLHYLKFYNNDSSHSSDGLGEGIISVFAIVDALYDSEPGDLIAIDEPELSLHPALQKRLASVLKRFSSERQIVLSTHSPYFVDIGALASGAHIVRVVSECGATRIHELSQRSKDALAKMASGKNLFNPHIFGLDAREIFFQEDRIILTEGQEDVLLYPSIAEQLDTKIKGNFFGWGSGGTGNLSIVARILKDLGFRKVAVIMDGEQELNERALREEFPDFFVRAIPAPDIRTKDARKETAAVEGLLDEKRDIRKEFAGQTKNILEELNLYLT